MHCLHHQKQCCFHHLKERQGCYAAISGHNFCRLINHCQLVLHGIILSDQQTNDASFVWKGIYCYSAGSSDCLSLSVWFSVA